MNRRFRVFSLSFLRIVATALAILAVAISFAMATLLYSESEYFLPIALSTSAVFVGLTIVAYALIPMLRTKRMQLAVEVAFTVFGLTMLAGLLDVAGDVLKRLEEENRFPEQRAEYVLRAFAKGSEGADCRVPEPPQFCSRYIRIFRAVQNHASSQEAIQLLDEFVLSLPMSDNETDVTAFVEKSDKVTKLERQIYFELGNYILARMEQERIARATGRLERFRSLFPPDSLWAKTMGIGLALIYFGVSIAGKMFDGAGDG
jgi:hypothetical protein